MVVLQFLLVLLNLAIELVRQDIDRRVKIFVDRLDVDVLSRQMHGHFSLLLQFFQDKIDLEKSQTIEVLNKLRESGLIIKIGNGPATSYKVLD